MKINNKFLSKPLITPFTITLFLFISITGIQMFFRDQTHLAQGLHEWLGLIFVLFGVLHLIANWKVFLTYIKKPTTIILLLVVLGVAPFLFIGGGSHEGRGFGEGHGPGGEGRGMGRNNPIREISTYIEKAPLAHVAPLFEMDEQKAIELLGAAGIKVANGEQTIADIATANGKQFFEILAVFSQDNVENNS